MRTGAKGIVEVSRTRDLRNTYILRGEKGSIDVDSDFDPLVRLILHEEPRLLAGRITNLAHNEKTVSNGWQVLRAFSAQFDEFAACIAEDRRPPIPGSEGRRAIELIESCYTTRKSLGFAWAN